MKLAIVYDRVNKWGGAERVLLALHEIWPDAPLYTAVYNKRTARWADGFRVTPSFLQHVPFAKTHHEYFPWLTPMAFESFNFDGYDVVLSVASAEAKDIITKPGTTHICYCLTPTRYLWSGYKEYEKVGGPLFRAMASTLRRWDLVASTRPDRYIAISRRVADRIRTYYHRGIEQVIYPPIDTKKFVPSGGREDFFLCVSRLVPYKRMDALIRAFNKLGRRLVIVGSGSELERLKRMANDTITFAGNLTDAELLTYYQRCAAFVSAADEDFGIVALEAQATGCPIICPRRSGMAETVVEGKTGELFDTDITEALHKFDKTRYDSDSCRRNAMRYDIQRFMKEMRAAIHI